MLTPLVADRAPQISDGVRPANEGQFGREHAYVPLDRSLSKLFSRDNLVAVISFEHAAAHGPAGATFMHGVFDATIQALRDNGYSDCEYVNNAKA